MISQELINTSLGVILSRLGKPVSNAALYKEELGKECPSDEEILAEAQAMENESELKKEKSDAKNEALSLGYDTGLGFSLSVSEYAQTRFAVLMTGLKNLSAPNDTILPIKDIESVPQKVTYDQFKKIMQGYTLHCLELEK